MYESHYLCWFHFTGWIKYVPVERRVWWEKVVESDAVSYVCVGIPCANVGTVVEETVTKEVGVQPTAAHGAGLQEGNGWGVVVLVKGRGQPCHNDNSARRLERC